MTPIMKSVETNPFANPFGFDSYPTITVDGDVDHVEVEPIGFGLMGRAYGDDFFVAVKNFDLFLADGKDVTLSLSDIGFAIVDGEFISGSIGDSQFVRARADEDANLVLYDNNDVGVSAENINLFAIANEFVEAEADEEVEVTAYFGGEFDLEAEEVDFWGSLGDYNITVEAEYAEIFTFDGNDFIDGSDVTEELMVSASEGNDMIVGGQGFNLLFGGDGADALVAGGEENELFGGRGADTFVFVDGAFDDAEVNDYDGSEGDVVFIQSEGFEFDGDELELADGSEVDLSGADGPITFVFDPTTSDDFLFG